MSCRTFHSGGQFINVECPVKVKRKPFHNLSKVPKKVTNGKSNCSNGKRAAVWGLHGETLLLNGSVKTCVTEVGFLCLLIGCMWLFR